MRTEAEGECNKKRFQALISHCICISILTMKSHCSLNKTQHEHKSLAINSDEHDTNKYVMKLTTSRLEDVTAVIFLSQLVMNRRGRYFSFSMPPSFHHERVKAH